jgi:hypothetical protein
LRHFCKLYERNKKTENENEKNKKKKKEKGPRGD